MGRTPRPLPRPRPTPWSPFSCVRKSASRPTIRVCPANRSLLCRKLTGQADDRPTPKWKRTGELDRQSAQLTAGGQRESERVFFSIDFSLHPIHARSVPAGALTPIRRKFGQSSRTPEPGRLVVSKARPGSRIRNAVCLLRLEQCGSSTSRLGKASFHGPRASVQLYPADPERTVSPRRLTSRYRATDVLR